jgi:hypothetical protein
MRRKWIAVMGLVLALGAVSVGTAASAEDPAAAPEAALAPLPCIANYVCVYTSTNFEGDVGYIQCSSFGTGLSRVHRSARNRCGGKWSRLSNGICMNAGGDRPYPGDFYGVTLPDYNHPNCP